MMVQQGDLEVAGEAVALVRLPMAGLGGYRTTAPDVFTDVVTNWRRPEQDELGTGAAEVVHAIVHRLTHQLEGAHFAALAASGLPPRLRRHVHHELDEADRVPAQ